MASLKTRQLLSTAAKIKQNKAQSLSRDEIQKKINEIKFLSEKKKVPRLSIRKEIMHLEKQLESLYQVEQKILRNEKQESIKVNSLKRQIKTLQKKITHANNPDIEEKIDKLTIILGELLAKSDTADNVRLKKELDKVLHKEKQKWESSQTKEESSEEKEIQQLSKTQIQRVRLIIKKTSKIRQIIERKLTLAKGKGDKVLIEKLKQDIILLEQKLDILREEYPELAKDIEEELMQEEQLAKTIGIQALPSQISPIRSQLETSMNQTSVNQKTTIKHSMMIHPTDNISQEPIAPAMMPQNQELNLEESLNQAGQEQMQQMTMQINGQASLQTTGFEEDNTSIQEELIAELPLPPPPKIKRR